ncbi:hypothetical protein FRC03_000507 [Tulasnella sp. 419]|nr:hypothetical protein FRC03_000507 [Tulasnella sp. 419]
MTDETPDRRLGASSALSTNEIAEPGITELRRQNGSTILVSKVGIYTVWEQIPSSGWVDWLRTKQPKLLREIKAVGNGAPYVIRYARDIIRLGPWHTLVYIACRFAASYIPMLQLTYSIAVFSTIEEMVTQGNTSKTKLAKVIAAPIICSAVNEIAGKICDIAQISLRTRVKFWYRELALQVRLRLDYPTSQSSSVQTKFSEVEARYRGGSPPAWNAFSSLVDTCAAGVEVFSLGHILMKTMKAIPNGQFIVVFSIVGSLLDHLVFGHLLDKYFARITNLKWIEMATMWEFAQGSNYKKDVLANGMEDLIKNRYHSARQNYGDMDDDYLYTWREPSPLLSLLINPISGNLTQVALAVYALTNPSTVQFSTFSAIVKTGETLQSTIMNIRWQTKSIAETISSIQSLYDIEKIQNEIADGEEHYSPDKEKESAMKVEFRNVSFSYPGATTPAIRELSFTLPAGSLCVIVGENGCGKSSTVNLLSRFYDPSEGEILIDDKPLKSLRIRDVRAATAILYQQYIEFPTTLAENIGLGDPEKFHNTELIKQAAKLGGSYDFINDLPHGFDTDLRIGRLGLYDTSGDLPEDSLLSEMMKDLKKDETDFSGGQYQRLALSRVFMRSFKPNVKLLVYDEPSAALDPKMEFELFNQLRALRGNKTMIFITHRFGHLTKYADLIIYMEKGHAIEQGTHAELLAANGAYAQLYNVQAQAFQ